MERRSTVILLENVFHGFIVRRRIETDLPHNIPGIERVSATHEAQGTRIEATPNVLDSGLLRAAANNIVRDYEERFNN